MYFPKEGENFQLEDLAFFNVEIDDPSNAVVIGQTYDYCWDDRCIFPPVKGSGLLMFKKNFIIYINKQLIIILIK